MTEASTTPSATSKIVATKIVITRAEGPVDLCRKPQTFEGPTCWADARAWLRSQAETFASFGCDKHDFVVTWSDGDTYEGRLDCKRDGTDTCVAKHVLEILRFRAGIARPARLNQDAYDDLIRCYGDASAFVDFLATVEIPE